MGVKLVGKQKMHWKPKGETEYVDGVRLHCVSTTNNSDFEGMRAETFFIRLDSPMYDQCASFPVGSELSVVYNRNGRADSIMLCDQKK